MRVCIQYFPKCIEGFQVVHIIVRALEFLEENRDELELVNRIKEGFKG